MTMQPNPNRPPNDNPRQERTGVGVYEDDRQFVDETTTTAAGTRGVVDPALRRDAYDESTMAPRTEPTTYRTAEPARSGASIGTWIAIAIIAVLILWLVFTFLL
jgi:hypothetical protein